MKTLPLVVTGWLTFGCGHGQRHAGGLEENSSPLDAFGGSHGYVVRL